MINITSETVQKLPKLFSQGVRQSVDENLIAWP